MGKGNKVVVFIILLIVFLFVGVILNEASQGLGGMVAGLGILYLFSNLFKKDEKGDDNEQKDIILKK